MRRIIFFMLLLISLCGYAQYNQLTNIPTIYIETVNNAPINSKENYVDATMVYVSGEETVEYELKIRGRGNSTWSLKKKPYRIKFNESTKFLGKGYAKNKSWTLLANHGDKSLLRNAVTARMGKFLGLPFNAAAHFVDLVINGTYLGCYQVSDQVNVDNKRVEIVEQEEIATDESNITGGYLLEIDGFAYNESVYFETNKGLTITIKSPDEDVISQSQIDYIRGYINSFESLLFSSNFTDSDLGYRPMLDSATVVPWYIATELSANVDGFWSTYIYKDQDDPKIYFGPLWDYDIAYDNCERVSGGVTNASMVEKGFGDALTKRWVKKFIQDDWFNNAVNDAWKLKRDAGLTDDMLHYIDSMAVVIDQSQQMNYSIYPIDKHVYDEIYLYSTYGEYINQLKEFITDHASYLTTLFASRAGDDSGSSGGDGGNVTPEELRPFELNTAYYYTVYNKGNGMALDVAETSNGGKGVVIKTSADVDTQLWKIEKVGDYYRLVNKAEGLALNDPSLENAVQTQLNLAELNADDTRQLWQFVVVNENDNYNIINVNTDFVVNNKGGFTSDSNPVISYYNDDKNSASVNRQWRIVREELIPDYIPEDVKAMLDITIAEAETFLTSLNDWEIGNAPFCYNSENIEALRQMVSEARGLESSVADDYILQNVNLVALLDEARQINIPSPTQQYVLKHINSGYVLNVTSSKAIIKQYDKGSAAQHFVIEQSGSTGEYLLKSESGYYLSFGSNFFGNISGEEDVTNSAVASLSIELHNGFYRIKTNRGLLGTTKVTENAKVFGDNSEANIDNDVYCDWILEEREMFVDDVLENKKTELVSLIDRAKQTLNNIPDSWVGTAPLQYPADDISVLEAVIEMIEGATYTTVNEYDEAIILLNEALGFVMQLNEPENKLYHLRHISGLNLSCANGLTLDNVKENDLEQCFMLIPVDGEMNSYNIFSNGSYLSVADFDTNMLMLSDTPRGENGRFVVTPVGDNTFTLTSTAGLLGVRIAIAGVSLMLNAADDGYSAVWSLVDAGVDIETGMADYAYEQNIDYVVRYDRARQVVGFRSNDIQELADVDVSIYTVGGRLLYTFKATQELSLADIPSGTYIIQWTWAGRNHSVKFKKE